MIEPLAAHHDRRDFSCGEPALDTYLRERAAQDVRRGLARVFVATGETRQSIAGYYSVSAASFARAELPAELAKRLPHYPVPAAVVGRLAVDRRHQGRRLGETLLLDAVRRALRASAAIAVYAVIVDAKNERARAFYQRYGFQSFPAAPSRLFLPLDTFVKAGL
jgi:ribosomal protein S18 acetylase RimI-like enzyme